MKKALLSLFFAASFLVLRAQQPDVEMADAMRRDGKIYVVVAVVLTIFAGIVIYLIRLDRKITKLEKEAKANTIIHP